MIVTCQSARCRSYGYHLPTCEDTECRGCAPRTAADGLNLCWPHVDQLARDALQSVEIHAELLRCLMPTSKFGEFTSGTKELGLDLNPRAVACRDAISETLALWAKLIVDERGISAPAASVLTLGQFVARHSSWLAAHPLAGPCSDELWELAHGEARRVAFPSGTRTRAVGGCPNEGCDGEIRAIMRSERSLVPSELACSSDRLHAWPVRDWLRLAQGVGSAGKPQRPSVRPAEPRTRPDPRDGVGKASQAVRERLSGMEGR